MFGAGFRAGLMSDKPGAMIDKPGRTSDQPRSRLGARPETLRRGGGLRRLPDLLGKVLDPASRRRGLAEARVLTDWPSIVGGALASRCQPVKLTAGGRGQGGVLHVHVAGSAALELQHSEPQLLERINTYFGYPAVARLRLIRAPLALPRQAATPAPIPLAPAERAEIEATVQAIADEPLRAALAGLGTTLKSRTGRPAQPDPLSAGKGRWEQGRWKE